MIVSFTIKALLCFSLLSATALGINIYKSTQTYQQWQTLGEAPLVDAVVVKEGVTSEKWMPYFMQSRNTFLISINSVLYAFRSAAESTDNLFVEDSPATSFVVNTRAAYNLEEITVSESTVSRSSEGEGSGLEITASLLLDRDRMNIQWLTVQYECKEPGLLSLVSARLRMYDFNENAQDVVFYWQKRCSEEEAVQLAEQQRSWLAQLSDLDPAKPLFDVLESDSEGRRYSFSMNDWPFLLSAIMMLLCIAGAAILVGAVLMDVIDRCVAPPFEDPEQGTPAEPVKEDDNDSQEADATKVQKNCEETIKVAEGIPPPPFPIFSTHLIQPDPVGPSSITPPTDKAAGL